MSTSVGDSMSRDKVMERINGLGREDATKAFWACCGCDLYSKGMAAAMPFSSREDMFAKSDALWATAQREDMLQAFLAHPKIGDSKAAAAHGGKWASGEQSGMNTAAEGTAAAMAKGNADYEAKMGFRYIVCATGKSADEMLQILLQRISNDSVTELGNGAAEQNKITHLRLNKLITEYSSPSL